MSVQTHIAIDNIKYRGKHYCHMCNLWKPADQFQYIYGISQEEADKANLKNTTILISYEEYKHVDDRLRCIPKAICINCQLAGNTLDKLFKRCRKQESTLSKSYEITLTHGTMIENLSGGHGNVRVKSSMALLVKQHS